MSFILLGILNSQVSSGFAGVEAYDLIAETRLSSSTSQITFSSIPSTYTHLELHISGQADTGGGYDNRAAIRLNNLTGSTNYTIAQVAGDGSGGYDVSTFDFSMIGTYGLGGFNVSRNSGSCIFRLPNYLDNQRQFVHAFGGAHSFNTTGGAVSMTGGATAASTVVNRIDVMNLNGGNLVAGTYASLIGIKA